MNIFKERISQADEISLKINRIIDDNSYNENLSHVNYVQIDTALKKARSLINEHLLDYKIKTNTFELNDFEKQAIIIKNSLYSLSFKKGPEENISSNGLILSLYKALRVKAQFFYQK
ncbi:MAG: hypothetical protein K2Q18_12580 [Bdellovibrionales bacterium]|nr:hypothetical protein [Bdellovibrionales bacterium]